MSSSEKVDSASESAFRVRLFVVSLESCVAEIEDPAVGHDAIGNLARLRFVAKALIWSPRPFNLTFITFWLSSYCLMRFLILSWKATNLGFFAISCSFISLLGV